MSDRIKALTVVLVDNLRDDDAQPLIDAIRLLQGVVSVKPHVADLDHYCAITEAKRDLRTKMRDVLWADD